MLRPEQMSKVSVTGSKAVMDDVVETVHDLNLVHLSDYDGSWEGFDNGDPVAGAEAAAEKLVTVRSLRSILGVEGDDDGRSRIVDDDLEAELEEVRQAANDLDDRRDEVTDELRAVEGRLDSMAPFAALGIDLDLLSGYDSLAVAVGEGDEEAIRNALDAASAVEAFEAWSAEGAVAVAAYPDEDASADDVLEEALVGVDFATVEVPDATGSPAEYVEDLRRREQELESELATVDERIEDLRVDAGDFLLAAEETLSIRVQKAEAPLRFATTENSFVAEGWVPTDRYDALTTRLRNAVGDRIDVEELERADYEAHEVHGHAGEEVVEEGRDEEEEEEPSADEEEPPRAVADGGTAVTMDDEPPVVQENPAPAKPFELLVQAMNRPKYSEFDPTVILWLTFPAFFGFMIGDLGYGLLYVAIGYWLYATFDSAGLRSLGGIGVWCGAFTALFGILYGEVFGLHQLGEFVWGHGHQAGLLGSGGPPLHKGLQPAEGAYARLWLTVALVVGLLHVSLGYVLEFVEDLSHGVVEAVAEDGSWLLMLGGLWAWIFSTHAMGPKPDFLVGEGSVFNTVAPFDVGFTGLPEVVGLLGLAAWVVGLVLIFWADWIEGVEAIFLKPLVNVLSYTRIAAVLLAKAGMAFVVNLLFFGAYRVPTGHGDEFHFLYFSDHTAGHLPEEAQLMFGGLANMGGVAPFVFGLVILLLGHGLVLALGVTSAGLQAVRLEYVEFFEKFYDGGGEKYEPFGYDRRYTTEE